ncbi:MAG: beta-lactamase family protein [Simkania sp.]|nr:beta-lactamase family protein [Simkania sp.]
MMMKTKTLLFFLLCLPLALLAKDSLLEQKLIEKIDAFANEHSVTGIAVAVIGRENHQKFTHIVARGTLSQKSPIPVNQYSEFRIGPVTQLFTAGTLAYFVQEGQVSLNDPISKFLPKSMDLPTYKGQEITLGDLATHTSGLPDLPYNLSSRASFSVSQMFRFLKNYELKRAPGTEYEYSNLGYAFLSNILMRISKRSFPDLVKQLLLDPLHLKDTTFTLTNEQKKRTLTGYEKGRGVSPLEGEKIYSVFIGAGGLHSTAHNMLTFLSFNMGKETTSLNAILPLMQQPYHAFNKFQVGLGWKITSFNAATNLFSIEGLLFGFASYLGMVPEADIGVMIMTSQGDLSVEQLGEEILQLLDQEKS